MNKTTSKTETRVLHIITRSLPKGGRQWGRPGYIALVDAPESWDTRLPLSATSLAKHGCRIVWDSGECDMKHTGPRSAYGQALDEARTLKADIQNGVTLSELGLDR